MRVKVVKDDKYNNIYDVYYKRWWGWSKVYWVSAMDIYKAKDKVNGIVNKPTLTWEI